MQYRIANKAEVDNFIFRCIENGSVAIAEKGHPPTDATYSDGEPIVRPWNVAFYDSDTGDRCEITYEADR